MGVRIGGINVLHCTDRTLHVLIALEPAPAPLWVRLFNEECQKKGMPDVEWCEALDEPRFHIGSSQHTVDSKMDTLDRILATTNERFGAAPAREREIAEQDARRWYRRHAAVAQIERRLRERYGLA